MSRLQSIQFCPSNPRGHAGSRRANRRRGFGLVELLISLAICAALLTAVAVAVDASFKSYQINQEQSSLTQRGRLTLYRLLTIIRTTDAHQPYTAAKVTSFSQGQTVTDTGITMINTAGVPVTYYYDPPSQELRIVQGGVTNVLLAGVQAFTVKMEPMKSANSIKTGSMTYDLLMRATVLITVGTNSKTAKSSETTGTQTVTISSAVMPRRNVW